MREIVSGVCGTLLLQKQITSSFRFIFSPALCSADSTTKGISDDAKRSHFEWHGGILRLDRGGYEDTGEFTRIYLSNVTALK